MKLFLGGGGGGKDSYELDKKFVENLDLSKPLLYIPIAIDTQKHPYPSCLEWLKSAFEQHGVKNIVMWTEEDLKDKTLGDFEHFCGIYIGGGNTFKLLKELKEFGTFEILKQLAEKNIPIYGGSAGAIIMGPTITNAIGYDENYLELTNLSSLNLTNGYEIWCHYLDPEEEKVREYMNKYNLQKVIAIPESVGLYICDSYIEVVGPSEVSVFNSIGSNKIIFKHRQLI